MSSKYEDKGCAYAPACLKCPFPTCIVGEAYIPLNSSLGRPKGAYGRSTNACRMIVVEGRRQGKSLRKLAVESSLSVRTVQRILIEARQEAMV